MHVLIISDTGVKNNVAMSITYIHVCNRFIIKTIYYVANITSTEAELFTIRCSINQATNIPEISKIIIITDSIYTVRSIFDSSIYLFQVHLAAISKELREFFSMNSDNLIEFWECYSWCNWPLFKAVDSDTKQLHQIPMLSCKSSWDLSKKREYDDIICNWKMMFQALDLKGQQFLDLVDHDNIPIELSCSNGRSWLKFIDYSNSLCTRVMRAIVNHTPIGEYRLHFFS